MCSSMAAASVFSHSSLFRQRYADCEYTGNRRRSSSGRVSSAVSTTVLENSCTEQHTKNGNRSNLLTIGESDDNLVRISRRASSIRVNGAENRADDVNSVSIGTRASNGAENCAEFDANFLFSYGVQVSATPPPPKQKETTRGKDYHVNVGYAIRSLREELPGMFYKEPTFSIYREDIVFRDPLISFSGISNYKLMFWGLRFYGRVFFKAIWIEIHRIWQPRDKVIMVRWTVYGIPRVPWEARGQFDATSEYKLDSDGLIYEHKVDNVVMNNPPAYKAPAVLDLVVRAAGAHTPTPSYYSKLFLMCLERFTWVRYYLALRSTLVLNAMCYM